MRSQKFLESEVRSCNSEVIFKIFKFFTIFEFSNGHSGQMAKNIGNLFLGDFFSGKRVLYFGEV